MVPHSKLIHKLSSYGIRGQLLQWFASFLQNRTQSIVIDSMESSKVTVKSGVPQGSVIGPFLFNIYVNDLADSTECDLFLFVDDTKLFTEVNVLDDSARLQRDLNRISTWASNNQLQFSAEKCVVIHLGRNNINANYILDSQSLQSSEEERDLGVIVDASLKFNKHVAAKVAKASQMLAIIKRSFSHLDEDSFVQLYKSLVRPHLEFASSVWSPYTVSNISSIERVQKRATKSMPHREFNVTFISYAHLKTLWLILYH